MQKITFYETYKNESGVYFKQERGYLESIRDHYLGVTVNMCFRHCKYTNGNGWRITHLESGVKIADCVNSTREEAIQTGIRLCGFVAETVRKGTFDDVIQKLNEYKSSENPE